jgi:hypothetical protein
LSSPYKINSQKLLEKYQKIKLKIRFETFFVRGFKSGEWLGQVRFCQNSDNLIVENISFNNVVIFVEEKQVKEKIKNMVLIFGRYFIRYTTEILKVQLFSFHFCYVGF